jgi:hypothetical protein
MGRGGLSWVEVGVRVRFWRRRIGGRGRKGWFFLRFNQRFGFNGGDDRGDNGATARVLRNLTLAIGLTYLFNDWAACTTKEVAVCHL